MCDYPFFIPQVVLFANSSLFWFKVTNEHREFRNYQHYYNEGKEQIQWRRVSLFSKKLTIRKHQERVVRKEKNNTLWAHVIDVQIYSRSRRHSQYSLEDPVQSATSYAAYLYDYESLFSNRNHNPLSKPNR